MNLSHTTATPRRDWPPTNSATELLAFRLELQTADALLSVLATAARLGATLQSITATENKAQVAWEVPDAVAHRLPLLLGQLIAVVAVRPVSVA